MTTAKVGSHTEIAEGTMKRVSVGNTDYCVINSGGKFFAVEDRCGHSNGPLSMGKVEDKIVTCPSHGAQFNIETGEVVKMPNLPAAPTAAPGVPPPTQAQLERARNMTMVRTYPMKRYEVKVQNGEIFIEVP